MDELSRLKNSIDNIIKATENDNIQNMLKIVKEINDSISDTNVGQSITNNAIRIDNKSKYIESKTLKLCEKIQMVLNGNLN